jgi:putative salt-induced outer membrane protein YdiY
MMKSLDLALSPAGIVLLLAIAPGVAEAQAVAPAPQASAPVTAAQDQPPPPPPRREGTAEFAFVGTTGNSDSQTLGVAGEFIVRPDLWVVKNRASFVRNKSEDVLTVEQFGYLFRVERILNPRTSAFGEYTYFRDEFAGFDHRNQLLGGISYKVIDLPEHLFFVDGGLGYLNEKRLTGDDISTATYALGAGYRWKLSETSEFSDEVRFTGGFDDAANWRVAQTASLTARINTLLSLKLSNLIRFTNLPAPGFEGTDTTTSVALVAKF